jgi:hypothetical protein
VKATARKTATARVAAWRSRSTNIGISPHFEVLWELFGGPASRASELEINQFPVGIGIVTPSF